MKIALSHLAGILAGLAVLAAASGGNAANAPAANAGVATRIDVYQRIAGVAATLCKRPELFGSNRGVDGKLSGEVGLAKLLSALSDAKISASVRAGYADWRGVRQQDAAAALNASNGCNERMFTLMLDRFHLTDVGTGRPISKPKSPAAVYRRATAISQTAPPSAATQTVTGNGNFQTIITGTGNTVVLPAVQVPVTEQQKTQAIESLKGQLANLAEFPNRSLGSRELNHIEGILTKTGYIHLYDVVSRYDQATILTVPEGSRILSFERKFYKFEEDQRLLEDRARTEIGKIVKVQFSNAWDIYLFYFEARAMGYTPERVKNEGGNFLNYEITWEDVERVFGELSKNPAVGPVMARQISTAVSLQDETGSILAAYKSN
jgi:hypothetical protein